MTGVGVPTAPATPAPGAAEAPALAVEHVCAGYGPYRALFDVGFTVPAGAVVALLGSNGAGKSTVARTVTGLVPCTSGTVSVAGRDVTGLPAYKIARAGVAHVPEGRGIFASLTVEENLVLTFRQRGGRQSVAGSLARAYEAFPVLGERRKQRGGTLSGGQQRLLSLAKVLVVPPQLLVADELSLGLAPVVVDAVYDGLREINRAGTALLVVEQQVDRVLSLAQEAVVLEHGAVAFAGPSSEAMAAVEQVLAARGEQTMLVERDAAGAEAGNAPDGGDGHRTRRWRHGRGRQGKNADTGGQDGGTRGEEAP
ncbi:MAG: ABC transporter ATP-binding protein [Acidimicrobiales bacterium]